MKIRIGVAVMAAALALYIVLVAQRAVILLTSGEPIAIAIGVSLVIIPVLAVWGLVREIWFGVRAEKLGEQLAREGALPTDEVGVKPSGRILRDDADALFPTYRADVEQNPDDWRAWYRLGLAYDASGDRRRAREAVRTAIRLEKASRR